MTQLHTLTSTHRTFRRGRFNRIVSDVMTFGLYERWYRRAAYEIDEQKIVIERGFLSPRRIEIPAAKIDGVHKYLSPFAGTSAVTIDTGNTTVAATFLTRADARRFAVSCGELKWEAERGKAARSRAV